MWGLHGVVGKPHLHTHLHRCLHGVGTKKIDCLTTTNLINLKSNTMKNTVQIYGYLLYVSYIRTKNSTYLPKFSISKRILDVDTLDLRHNL